MRIALTYQNGNIYEHFGHTKQLKIYDIENKNIKTENIIDVNEKGHGALVGLLLDNFVDVLICGGIGDGAKEALKKANIKLYGGVYGNADSIVNDFINGKLKYVDISSAIHCKDKSNTINAPEDFFGKTLEELQTIDGGKNRRIAEGFEKNIKELINNSEGWNVGD